MNIDDRLKQAGFITITQRLECDQPLDSFARHASVNTLADFKLWLKSVRRENMEMIARHDLGEHELSTDIADFVYGKSAILWEVDVNLTHVLKLLEKHCGS